MRTAADPALTQPSQLLHGPKANCLVVRLSRLAVFILFFAIAGIIVAAEHPMTKLRIEVRSPSDKPVERASVVVKLIVKGPDAKIWKRVRTEYELQTNQEGVTATPEFPQGQILIQVIAKGYQTFGQVFEVREPEKTIEVKLNPPQAQYSAHEPLKK